MVENLDAVEQYIIRQDDDEDEAVEDKLELIPTTKNIPFRSHNVKASLYQWLV